MNKLLVMLFFAMICFYGSEVLSCQNETAIYFVNGVWNTWDQAWESLNKLKNAYEEQLKVSYPDEKFEFKLAYNHHDGKVRDLIEVIGQKLTEAEDPTTNKWTAAQYYILYMAANVVDAFLPSVATEAIKSYLASRLTDAVDVAAHIALYQEELKSGKRVLLIAHSQGNMFANGAMSALMGTYGKSIGNIGVASPAAYIVNESVYYTAYDDQVINALRLLMTVLPANIDNSNALAQREWSNHQFIDSYFQKALPSRQSLRYALYDYMEFLQFPGLSEVDELHITGPSQVSLGDVYQVTGGRPPYLFSLDTSDGRVAGVMSPYGDVKGRVDLVNGCSDDIGMGKIVVTDSCNNKAFIDVRLPGGRWVFSYSQWNASGIISQDPWRSLDHEEPFWVEKCCTSPLEMAHPATFEFIDSSGVHRTMDALFIEGDEMWGEDVILEENIGTNGCWPGRSSCSFCRLPWGEQYEGMRECVMDITIESKGSLDTLAPFPQEWVSVHLHAGPLYRQIGRFVWKWKCLD